MSTGLTSSQSILNKPLNQLTDDDISQLTREDCRRFLKAKGMRRPSWNKAQAIQQVICLKSLLESSHISGAAACFHKVFVSPSENRPPASSNSADSVRELSADADVQISVAAEESVQYGGEDSPKPAPSGELAGDAPHADKKAISPRDTGLTNLYSGQMTIFYCGKVNVYDEVPVDKARAVMHFAASPNHLPQDDPSGTTTAPWSFPCHLQTANVKVDPLWTGSTGMLTDQMNRKILLQKYLEKRRDRYAGRLNLKSPNRSYRKLSRELSP
ncbi:protein TIFY 4B-like isoform X2 [Malania oleifera]|uniref:protein TIFY 4B-like isoform X2 n=1 Tax=Malania oleifera TaxID=397392 RepID=UPI0025ADFBE7|nr:protein TIFY 4B-like isoform X2 [Malania oleifera]